MAAKHYMKPQAPQIFLVYTRQSFVFCLLSRKDLIPPLPISHTNTLEIVGACFKPPHEDNHAFLHLRQSRNIAVFPTKHRTEGYFTCFCSENSSVKDI